jgi:aarF domain-containing kinase
VQHALKTKELFSSNPHVYVPTYHTRLCSERLIVMEFVRGSKVNNREEIERSGIDPRKVAANLVSIFTDMIFRHRFIHCDAHPGNLLVRVKPSAPLGHEIILLDHGLYRSVSAQTVEDFSGLWVSLVLQDRQRVHDYAERLSIHEHFEYLPLIFLHRSANSSKRIGEGITAEERRELREKDLANFDSINNILQDLPPEIMFIIRATNLVGSHANALGASNRERLLNYTKASLR